MALSKQICKIEYDKKDISAKNVAKFLKNLEKYVAKAGIQEEDAQKLATWTDTRHQDVKLVEKAKWLEFGRIIPPGGKFKSYLTGEKFDIKTKRFQPQRICFRLYAGPDKKQVQTAISQSFKKMIEGFKKSPMEIFKQVADDAAFWQHSRIYLDQLKPRNRPDTIRYKGFDHPGFMTGQLVDNIKGKVDKR